MRKPKAWSGEDRKFLRQNQNSRLSVRSEFTPVMPAQAGDKTREVNGGGYQEVGVSRAHRNEHLGGYLIIPHAGNAERQYNAGYSMYVAAWPLLSYYPGHRFQTGLPGTWMFAQYDGAAPKDMYSDVEGGLGWWTDTRFPTTTPKFIMGGVGPNFSEIANGPAHGSGTWEDPRGLYGVAQLSPWLLFPLDGLNVKQGECGGLFGYGYLNLPLCEPKPTTEGKDIPTGSNCWTLFLNTGNFKGPVAFFLPNFWSHATVRDPRLAGQLLDSRPMDPNRAVQMETQYTPAAWRPTPRASGTRASPPSRSRGTSAAPRCWCIRTPPTTRRRSTTRWRPGSPAGSRAAAPSPRRGPTSASSASKGYATWQIWWNEGDGPEKKVPIDLGSFSTPTALDPHTFGIRWNDHAYGESGRPRHSPGVLPPGEWQRCEAGEVGAGSPRSRFRRRRASGEIKWTRPAEEAPEPYTTPDDPASSWKKPGRSPARFRRIWATAAW